MKLLPLFFLLFSISLFAQQEATTKDGRKVLLKSDGTWEFVEVPKVVNRSVSASVNCSANLQTVNDKVTGKSSVTGSERILVAPDGKTGFAILTMKSGDSIILAITAVEKESGCIDGNGTISVLFRDGSRLQFAHDSKFNYDGEATVYFGGVFGRKVILDQLKTKEIETLRVQTFKSSITRDFTPAQSKMLKEQLSCLDSVE